MKLIDVISSGILPAAGFAASGVFAASQGELVWAVVFGLLACVAGPVQQTRAPKFTEPKVQRFKRKVDQ